MVKSTKYPQLHVRDTSSSTRAEQSDAVARKARDQALAAGLTVTVYKEGQLIQEQLVAGKIKTSIRPRHEDDAEV